MSYQPHLSRGGELYHGRKAISEGGAPNGFSNIPGRRPTGKPRLGRLVGYDSKGNPIYDYRVRQAPTGNSGGGQRRNQNIFERAGSAISGAANRIGRNVSGAAGSAGNWLRNRARDVSGAAGRVGSAISGYAKRARTAIGNAWDGKAGAGSAKDDADLYRSYEQRNIKAGNKDKAVGYHKKASNAEGAYDRSIVGSFNSARNNVGNWLNERASDISGYAKRAGTAIGTAAGRARTAIGNAWDGKAGRGSAKDDADLYRSYEQRNIKAGNKDKAVGYHKKASNAQGAFDRSIVGTANRLLNRAGSAVRGAGEAISSGARRIGDAAGDLRDNAVGAVRTYKQNRKNSKNAAGGREAQQAKGNQINAQESKKAQKKAERRFESARKELLRLSNEMEKYSPNDPKYYDAQQEYNKWYNDVYLPTQRTYNAGKPKKK